MNLIPCLDLIPVYHLVFLGQFLTVLLCELISKHSVGAGHQKEVGPPGNHNQGLLTHFLVFGMYVPPTIVILAAVSRA